MIAVATACATPHEGCACAKQTSAVTIAAACVLTSGDALGTVRVSMTATCACAPPATADTTALSPVLDIFPQRVSCATGTVSAASPVTSHSRTARVSRAMSRVTVVSRARAASMDPAELTERASATQRTALGTGQEVSVRRVRHSRPVRGATWCVHTTARRRAAVTVSAPLTDVAATTARRPATGQERTARFAKPAFMGRSANKNALVGRASPAPVTERAQMEPEAPASAPAIPTGLEQTAAAVSQGTTAQTAPSSAPQLAVAQEIALLALPEPVLVFATPGSRWTPQGSATSAQWVISVTAALAATPTQPGTSAQEKAPAYSTCRLVTACATAPPRTAAPSVSTSVPCSWDSRAGRRRPARASLTQCAFALIISSSQAAHARSAFLGSTEQNALQFALHASTVFAVLVLLVLADASVATVTGGHSVMRSVLVAAATRALGTVFATPPQERVAVTPTPLVAFTPAQPAAHASQRISQPTAPLPAPSTRPAISAQDEARATTACARIVSRGLRTSTAPTVGTNAQLQADHASPLRTTALRDSSVPLVSSSALVRPQQTDPTAATTTVSAALTQATAIALGAFLDRRAATRARKGSRTLPTPRPVSPPPVALKEPALLGLARVTTASLALRVTRLVLVVSMPSAFCEERCRTMGRVSVTKGTSAPPVSYCALAWRRVVSLAAETVIVPPQEPVCVSTALFKASSREPIAVCVATAMEEVHAWKRATLPLASQLVLSAPVSLDFGGRTATMSALENARSHRSSPRTAMSTALAMTAMQETALANVKPATTVRIAAFAARRSCATHKVY
jgi:hypothetical protein